jgi:two-component system, LytTR family, response regulator
LTVLSALIVDDEQPARELMISLLRAWPSVDIVGEAADGASALRLIASTLPDLVFLDVQMPGGSGFDVISALPPEHHPIIVFTTAFDAYALRAFEVSAYDYLLKPFDAARLAKTMARVLDLETRSEQLAQSRFRALAGHLRGPGSDAVVVKSDGRHIFLRRDEIEWIEAVGKEARFHMKGKTIETRETMTALESRLDPAHFVRVHRSAIVNRKHVAQVQSWFKGDFVIVLSGGARVVSGRTYRSSVHALLGTSEANG